MQATKTVKEFSAAGIKFRETHHHVPFLVRTLDRYDGKQWVQVTQLTDGAQACWTAYQYIDAVYDNAVGQM